MEQLNEEIKCRTPVVRIFPNTESCLRLIRALCVETHETRLDDSAREINRLPDNQFAQLDAYNFRIIGAGYWRKGKAIYERENEVAE